MTPDLLDIEPEPEQPVAAAAGLDIEPDDIDEALPTIAAAAPADAQAAEEADNPIGAGLARAVAHPLVEILGPEIPLPTLIRFVADPRLREAAAEATAYALGIEVQGPEGIERADLALQALRTSQTAITAHFAEPAEIAHALHKRITGLRAEWLQPGDEATKTVGRRVWAERQRLEALAAEQRRKDQAEADRQAREAAKRDADAAAAAKAPSPVVDELKRRAETASAPPVVTPAAAPAMRANTVVTTWKARLVGTTGDESPNPDVAQLAPAQLIALKTLLAAILNGTAPVAAIEINWSYLNKRAASDKSTLAIPGVEVFQDGGVRARPARRGR